MLHALLARLQQSFAPVNSLPLSPPLVCSRLYPTGTVQILSDPAKRGPIVANVYGQFEMGQAGKYKRVPLPPGGESTATRYRWFKAALDALAAEIVGGSASIGSIGRSGRPLQVAFPHGIGCGLAGGSWPAYSSAISQFAKDVGAGVHVVLVKLG
jgi:hypothetical protein